MQLQTIITSKISKVGKSSVIKSLKITKTYLSPEDRYHIENLIIYITSLYECYIDVEYDFITYANEINYAIEILTMNSKERNCYALLQLASLLSDCLQQVESVRKLA